jgi:hypothetical protein
MLIHNTGWEIIRDSNGGYWLKPPRQRDPQQRLIEMPSKNPLLAAMSHAQNADNTHTDVTQKSEHQLAS